jgi:hypothetical protein
MGYERKVLSTFGRFTLEVEEIVGAPSFNIILLDGADQVGMDDGPEGMVLDVSDEQLLENCELDEEEAKFVQGSTAGVKEWLAGLGIKVIRED